MQRFLTTSTITNFTSKTALKANFPTATGGSLTPTFARAVNNFQNVYWGW